MHECSKAVARRLHDARFATRWFIGDGIDVGAGGDSLGNDREFFPGMRTCRACDLPDGNAPLLEDVADDSLDSVQSSHCLEHLREPAVALDHWIRVLEPGGDLVVIVPDEDLHEQGVFPSTFNTDHKWTFTIAKFASWLPRSINVTNPMKGVSDRGRGGRERRAGRLLPLRRHSADRPDAEPDRRAQGGGRRSRAARPHPARRYDVTARATPARTEKRQPRAQ